MQSLEINRMEISEVCKVAGDWPTGSTGVIAEPIWLQNLTLSPEEDDGKKADSGLSVSL